MNDAVRLVALTLIVSGCAGVSSIRYSKPAPEDGTAVTTVQEKYVGEMYAVKGIAYHVYPGNSASKDLMLFPFPLPTSNPAPGVPPFVVGVALKAATGGYSFEPSRVEYWGSDARRIHPARIQGPFPCDSQKPRPAWKQVTTGGVEQLPNSCSYMWLEFETTPPDPSHTFFVQVAGLRSAEGDVVLPVLRFEEATRTETFAVP
jgi:hypothetical protein